MQNYSLNRSEKQKINEKTVYRIISNEKIEKKWDDLALHNKRTNIEPGEKLGWLMNESNMDLDGSCCVLGAAIDSATIRDCSFVDEKSLVCGHSLIKGKSTIVRSTIENAHINDSKIIGSNIAGNITNDKNGIKISGDIRIIDSLIKDNVEIEGKVNINCASIEGNAKIKGDVFIRKGASFDINKTYGWPYIRENANINGKITIGGSVDISGDISITDEAVIIGDIEISGKGRIAGNAEIGLSERLPDGKILIKSPSILSKKDFGAKEEMTEYGDVGVFCYRKNNKIHGIEYVAIINEDEIARSNNIKTLIKNVYEKEKIAKRYDYLLDAINETDIEGLIKKEYDYSEMSVHASVAMRLVQLLATSKGDKKEFEENLKRFLKSCKIDIKSNKISYGICSLRYACQRKEHIYKKSSAQ